MPQGLVASGTGIGTGTTSSSSDSPYQNEDYRVPPPDLSPPPLPVPDTYEQAEQIVVDVDQLVSKPPAMSWAVAGSLSGAGQTAYLDWLDFNGDGAINALDFGMFRSRFGSGVP